MYQIYGLKCNYMRNPIGINGGNPVFTWRLSSDRKGSRQRAYQVRVWNEEGILVWAGNSKTEEEAAKNEAIYAGVPLKTGQSYNWQVYSKGLEEEEAESEKAFFTAGVQNQDFWKGKWITHGLPRKPLKDVTDAGLIFSGAVKSNPCPENVLDKPVYFRKGIKLVKEVKKALAYVTARGIYELEIDKETVSTPLTPGYTAYASYLEYQICDITGRLTKGEHEIGCWLADGWYTGKIGLMGVGEQYGSQNAWYLQIEITYMDGSRERIVTDESFLCGEGCYRYGDLFVGECLDENLECISSQPALELDLGFRNLRGLKAEPVRILRTIKPKVIRTPKGELVLDAGENIVGYTRFFGWLSGGVCLELEHSEVLDREGNFHQNILGQNKNQKDVFITRGPGIKSYTPKFTYHGFRYVKITGIEDAKAEAFTIVVLGTDLEQTGSFVTSHALLNQLQANIFRSQQGNMLSIPTDCPQRERAGWTGDMQVYAPTACFNMDVRGFLGKWLENMRLEQLKDGQIPNVVPSIDSNKFIDGKEKKHICSAGWGDACVIVPYRLYEAYGDRTVLEENLDMMLKWMEYVENQAETTFPADIGAMQKEQAERQKYLWNTEFHFGDWLIPSITGKSGGDPMESAMQTKEYAATAMYAYTTGLMADICGILGLKEKEIKYRELNENIRRAFSDEYVSQEGLLPLPLQGLYVLALSMGLADEKKKPGCVKELVRLIHENQDCLDTGFLSVPFLLDCLCEQGESALAYTLLYQKRCPSWLYEILQGATSIWESWYAILPDGTRSNSSYNHFAFGCVGDFLYRHILGLKPLLAGYRRVRIAPDYSCGLTWAKGSYESPYGKITIEWKQEDGKKEIRLTLPPGTEGILELGGADMPVTSGSHRYEL